MSEIYNDTLTRILLLIKERGIREKDLLIATELPLSSISMWKKRNSKPKNDALVKIAQYFEVSTDYLLGLRDE